MKTVRITTVVLLVAIAFLAGYANLRTLSVTERLPSTSLVSFQLQGNTHDRHALEKKVSNTRGVTACTINRDGNTASVIYVPDKISEEEIGSLLASGHHTVTKKEMTTSGGCPVHAASASFQQLLHVLDLRAH